MARPRVCDHDVALNLWAGGRTLTRVAEIVGASEHTVKHIIKRARLAGDPRADRRTAPWPKTPRPPAARNGSARGPL